MSSYFNDWMRENEQPAPTPKPQKTQKPKMTTEQKIKQLELKAKKLKEKQSKQDTAEKVLIGALVLADLLNNTADYSRSDKAKWLVNLIDKSREIDKKRLSEVRTKLASI